MRFSVVEIGYDQRQVDACLDELAAGLARLAARAEGAAEADERWEQLWHETCLLRRVLDAPPTPSATGRRLPAGVEREAVEILARARAELQAARDEARQVREGAYADALRARRDFEAVLAVRRRREEEVDAILRGAPVGTVPAETATAAAGLQSGGVPATRSAGGPTETDSGPATSAEGRASTHMR